ERLVGNEDRVDRRGLACATKREMEGGSKRSRHRADRRSDGTDRRRDGTIERCLGDPFDDVDVVAMASSCFGVAPRLHLERSRRAREPSIEISSVELARVREERIRSKARLIDR